MWETILNKVHLGSYADVLPNIPDCSIDAVITDPPFGISYQNQRNLNHAILAGDESEFSYHDFSRLCFAALKQDKAIFSFTKWNTYPRHFTEMANSGFLMKEPLICQKCPNGSGDLYGTFQSNSDWCMFGHKGRFVFRKTQIIRNKKAGKLTSCRDVQPVREYKTRLPSAWFGEDYPWSSENSSFQKHNNIFHPTIKGLDLIKTLILLCTDEGDTVLDPFIGSGTTAVAARETGRNFIGCEIDPIHYQTCMRRLNVGSHTA